MLAIIAKRVQCVPQHIGVDAPIVLGHGDHPVSHALQQVAEDVIERVGRNHDAARQQLRERVEKAGRPARADDDLSAIERRRVEPADGVIDQKRAQRVHQIGRTARPAVVQRRPIALRLIEDDSGGLGDAIARDGVFVDVSYAEVDIDAVAEIRGKGVHHSVGRRRHRGGLSERG